MKYLFYSLICFLTIFTSFNSFAQVPQQFEKKDFIDIEEVDKKAEKWEYLLNNEYLEDLPEIHIDGTKKYLPIGIVRHLGAKLLLDKENRTASFTNNKKTFLLKPNSKEMFIRNRNFLLQDPPLWLNDTIYVPTNFVLHLDAFTSERFNGTQFNVLKSFNKVKETEIINDSNEFKLTISFTKIPVYDLEKYDDHLKITFFGTDIIDKTKFEKGLSDLNKFFSNVEYKTNNGITELFLYRDYFPEIFNYYNLSKPNRFVLSFPSNFTIGKKTKIKDGFYHSEIKESIYQDNFKYNLLEINDLDSFKLAPVVARDDEGFLDLKNVSQITDDYGAFGAVNGGFFSGNTKTPLGLLMINKKLIAPPIYNRSALLMSGKNNFSVKNIDLKISLEVYDSEGNIKSIPISFFNRKPYLNSFTLFSKEFGKVTRNKEPKKVDKQKDTFDDKNPFEIEKSNLEISLNSETINEKVINEKVYEGWDYDEYIIFDGASKLQKSDNYITDIPLDGYVLHISGNKRDWFSKAISNGVYFEVKFDFSEDMFPYNYAIGGGPTLIKDSSINITDKLEKFKKDVTNGRAPRTAFGIIDDRKIILITVDGRQKSSRGISLEDLAYLMKSYGVSEAINLDGGGSTIMKLDGKVINSISGKKERKVSNAILIISN